MCMPVEEHSAEKKRHVGCSALNGSHLKPYEALILPLIVSMQPYPRLLVSAAMTSASIQALI